MLHVHMTDRSPRPYFKLDDWSIHPHYVCGYTRTDKMVIPLSGIAYMTVDKEESNEDAT